MKTRLYFVPLAAVLCISCGAARPTHPPLSPQIAQQLLRFNTRAANHLKFVQHENRTCEYVVHLPDQSGHPNSIEVDHIVSCGGRTDLKAFDASVEYEWNQTKGSWEITHFGS